MARFARLDTRASPPPNRSHKRETRPGDRRTGTWRFWLRLARSAPVLASIGAAFTASMLAAPFVLPLPLPLKSPSTAPGIAVAPPS